MRLADHLSEQGISDDQFAKRLKDEHGIDVTGEAVRLWKTGARIPRRQAMMAIQAMTDGKVMSGDFFVAA